MRDLKDSRAYIRRELSKQETLKKRYLQQLKSLPEGRLIASHIGEKMYYTVVENGKKTYLGDGSVKMVKDLQQRRFIEKSLQSIENNLALMHTYLEKYKPVDQASIIEALPKAYKDSVVLSSEDDPWGSMSYDRNMKYPEGLVHQTLKGDMVRSKSEALLANMLYEKGIPYHYEENIVFPEKIIAPDFKIKVESEGRFKLLEHCGLIGNERYARSFTWKLQLYMRNGYMPWRDVFFTFDDRSGSIDTKLIGALIDDWFL